MSQIPWIAAVGAWLSVLVLGLKILLVLFRVSSEVGVMRFQIEQLWARVMGIPGGTETMKDRFHDRR